MFDKQTNIVNTLKLKKDIQFRDSENVITQKKKIKKPREKKWHRPKSYIMSVTKIRLI